MNRIFEELRKFSREEHTEENLEFFEAVSNFKRYKQIKQCSNIVNGFIREGGIKQINIDHDTRCDIIRKAKQYEVSEVGKVGIVVIAGVA
eukprot:Pgem_evm1s5801